jgi:hypothetical protein
VLGKARGVLRYGSESVHEAAVRGVMCQQPPASGITFPI